MFLHIRNGWWLGTKGILLSLLLFIAVGVGFGWWWGFKNANKLKRRRNVLLYGVPEGPHRNIFHHIGDLWSFLFK